jgi:hypothetical protein
MEDVVTRFWENVVGRVTGPMSFRLILQPSIAIFLAIRAGRRDARAGRPPYFVTILMSPGDRHGLLAEGWKEVAKVFVMAILIDVAYQVMVIRWVYPIEALFVAFLLAILPYLAVRGLTDRAARARGAMAASRSARQS